MNRFSVLGSPCGGVHQVVETKRWSLLFLFITLCLWLFIVKSQASQQLQSLEPCYNSLSGDADWLKTSFATRNWWGLRDDLLTNGVDLSMTYVNNIAGNPVGGMRSGMTYCDDITMGLKVHTDPLLGWQGGVFNIVVADRNGNSLTQHNVGNTFLIQEIWGGTGVIVDDITYEQNFCRNLWNFKFGRMGVLEDFDNSPLYWLYMNCGLEGHTQTLPLNGQVTSFPWTSWGARIKGNLTSDTQTILGVYQVTPNSWFSSMHGLNMTINPSNGVMMVGQYEWDPEIFRQPVNASSCNSPEEGCNNPGKVIPHGLTGHYWMGGYYSSWTYPQLGNTQGTPGQFGLYWHADQMVYRREPTSNVGLTAWSAFLLCPEPATATLPFSYNGGLVYQGLIPSRPQDESIFGICYGSYSSVYAQANKASLGGVANYELVYELGHKINLTKYAFFEPDLQWIVNPGGTGQIPNTLVVGAQMGVTF